ncbi:MAG TPA: glycosyltransferase [bacterium]|nr:glycosyltransferase [bacterium]
MRALVLSSQAKNTGSTLRAEYIHKYLNRAGIKADYISPPFNSMVFMADFFLSLFYYFFRVLNKRYDAVFIVKPYPNTVLPALLLKFRGAPIIIDVDDLDYGYRGGVLSVIIEKMQAYFTGFADWLTSHNTELIRLILRRFPRFKGKVLRLNQCVDTEIFRPSKKVSGAAGKLKKMVKGKRVLFYMAHLNIAGYLGEILESARAAAAEGWVLVVAGGGPLLNRYKKEAFKQGLEDFVFFTGPLAPREAAGYAAASDICLVYYSGRYVNRFRASMKLREYLAMNKPVVANSMGEIREFKKIAYVSGASKKSFTAEIRRRIKNLDKRHEKGYKFIKANFDWRREAEKLAGLIRVLIRDKNKKA